MPSVSRTSPGGGSGSGRGGEPRPQVSLSRMRVRALLGLAAVSGLLSAPTVAPTCAQVSSSPCCAAGMEECAGMTSVGLCCQPAPTSRDDQGLLSQAAPERPPRPQVWVGAPASPVLAGLTADVSPISQAPRAREDLTPASFSVLRI